MQSTLLSLFSEVSDPRRGQGKMYSLAPILLFTVLAMLAGASSYRQVHAFIQIHRDRLNAAFGMSLRKAPAYTTLRFILRGLDAGQLERVFSEMRLAYTAVRFQKRSLLNRLSDRSAWASAETLQDYKESLFYLRRFELKFRKGFYVRFEIGERT